MQHTVIWLLLHTQTHACIHRDPNVLSSNIVNAAVDITAILTFTKYIHKHIFYSDPANVVMEHLKRYLCNGDRRVTEKDYALKVAPSR